MSSEQNDVTAILGRLQEHVPFLKDMIVNLKIGMPQHDKIVALHNMITNKKRKFKYDTLRKCEEVIQKMKSKTNYKPPPRSPNDDDNYTIDSPDPDVSEHIENQINSSERYVQEKPSIYSSVAETLGKPVKTNVFDRLGAIVPVLLDTSKPPLSVADLELLKSDDVEVEEPVKVEEKVVPPLKKESKISLVPAPIIKPKQRDKKPESEKTETVCRSKNTPLPVKKPAEKVIKDSDSIFGNLLSSIDDKIRTQKRPSGGGDKSEKGSSEPVVLPNVLSNLFNDIDRPRDAKNAPEKVYKRLADKYNPKPRKPSASDAVKGKGTEDAVVLKQPAAAPAKIPFLSPERNLFADGPQRVDPRMSKNCNSKQESALNAIGSPLTECPMDISGESPTRGNSTPRYSNPLAPPEQEPFAFNNNQGYNARAGGNFPRMPNRANFQPRQNFNFQQQNQFKNHLFSPFETMNNDAEKPPQNEFFPPPPDLPFAQGNQFTRNAKPAGMRTPNSYNNAPNSYNNPGAQTPNAYNNPGGQTPNAYNNPGAQTPNPFNNPGGQTPNPFNNPGGQTPNPFNNPGSQTPNAYNNAGPQTPNPYGGNQTPNHYANTFGGGGGGGGGASGSQTPNPYTGPKLYQTFAPPFNGGNRFPQPNYQYNNRFNNRDADTPSTYKSWREERESRDPRLSRNTQDNFSNKNGNWDDGGGGNRWQRGDDRFARGKSATRDDFRENRFAREKSQTRDSNDERFQRGKSATRDNNERFARGKSVTREESNRFTREKSAPREDRFARGKSVTHDRFARGKSATRDDAGKDRFARGKSMTRDDGNGDRFARDKSVTRERGKSREHDRFSRGKSTPREDNDRYSRGKSASRDKAHDRDDRYSRVDGKSMGRERGKSAARQERAKSTTRDRTNLVDVLNPGLYSCRDEYLSKTRQKLEEEDKTKTSSDRVLRNRSKTYTEENVSSGSNSRDHSPQDGAKSPGKSRRSKYDEIYSSLLSEKEDGKKEVALQNFKIPKKNKPEECEAAPEEKPEEKPEDKNKKDDAAAAAAKELDEKPEKTTKKKVVAKKKRTIVSSDEEEPVAAEERKETEPPVLTEKEIANKKEALLEFLASSTEQPKTSEVEVSSSDDPPPIVSSSTEDANATPAEDLAKKMETQSDKLGLPPTVKEEFKKFISNISKSVGAPMPLLEMFGMLVDYIKPADAASTSAVAEAGDEIPLVLRNKEADEEVPSSSLDGDTKDTSESSPTFKRKVIKKVKKGGKRAAAKKVIEDSDDELTLDALKRKMPPPKRARRSELDKLHEDIKETMGEGVLAVANKRSCTIHKEIEEGKVKVDETILEKVKEVKVVLQKLPDLRKPKRSMEVEPDEAVILPKRRSLTRASKSISNYEESTDDNAADLEAESVEISEEVLKPPEDTKVLRKRKTASLSPAKTPPKKKKPQSETSADETTDSEKPAEDKSESSDALIPSESEDDKLDKSASETECESELCYVEPDKNHCLHHHTDATYKCKVCDFEGAAIVDHYAIKHPKIGCVISRLPPENTEQALLDAEDEDLEDIELLDKRSKHYFRCRFCLHAFEEVQSLYFFNHLTKHTGEFRFKCTKCHYKTSERKALLLHYPHEHNVEPTYTQATADFIPALVKKVCGYVCSECNYLQLNKLSVEEHIQIYHLDDTAYVRKINMSLKRETRPKPLPKQKKVKRLAAITAEVNIKKLDHVSKAIEDVISTKKSEAQVKVAAKAEPEKAAKAEVKELDISVFMCNTDIEDETTATRLEKMKEINESVAPRRTSIVNKLKDRLDQEDQAKKESESVEVAKDVEAVVAAEDEDKPGGTLKLRNDLFADAPKEPEFVDVSAQPIATVPAISLTALPTTSSMTLPMLTLPALNAITVLNHQTTTTTTTSTPPPIITISAFGGGSAIALSMSNSNSNSSDNLPPPVLTPIDEELHVDEVKTPLLPKLCRVDSSLTPSRDACRIFTAAGVSVALAKDKELRYECKKSCVFVSSTRALFESHCNFTHRMEKMELACSECSERGLFNREQIFRHLCKHVDDELVKRNEAESIVISDDEETPKFSFKIASIQSLAPKKPPPNEQPATILNELPTLIPFAKAGDKPPPPPPPILFIKKTTPSAEPSKVLTCRIVPLNEEELRAHRKDEQVLKLWSQRDVWGRLFKCPFFACYFTSDKEDAFESHLHTHNYTGLVYCLYCNFKMKPEYYSIHLVVRHRLCIYGCPHCLYRAVAEEYVKSHLKEEHADQADTTVLRYKEEVPFTRYRCPPLKSMKEYMKPYTCKCSKKYYAKENFTKHLRACTESKARFIAWNIFEYNCRYCVFSEPTKRSFLKHMSKHHPYHPICIVTRHLKEAEAVQEDEDATIFDKLKNITALNEDDDESVVELSSNDESQTASNNQMDESTDLSTDNEVEDEAPVAVKTAGLSGSELFKCGECKKGYASGSALRNHFAYCSATQGKIKKKLACPHCEKVFKAPVTLVEHVKLHGVDRIGCSLCSHKSTHKLVLRNHMKAVHKINNCKFVPMDPAKANVELDEFIVLPATARISDAEASSNEPPGQNANDRPPNTYGPDNINLLPIKSIFNHNVTCNLCNFQTKVRMNFIRHMSQHEQGIETTATVPVNPVPCLEKKELMFDKMTNLASSSHAGGRMGGKQVNAEPEVDYPAFVEPNKRYVCGAVLCNYLCLEEAMMKHHLQALHAHETTYRCAHCKTDLPFEREYIDVHAILKHLRLHENALYKCGHCAHLSNVRANVEKHCGEKHAEKTVKIVTVRQPADAGEKDAKKKPWKCSMCKYKFHSKEDVRAHVQTKHAIDSQYKCSYCTYKSDDRDSFGAHFDANHENQQVDVIVSFYYSEGEVSAAAKEELAEPFDTTPLWLKNKNHVKHIRGILLEEQPKLVAKKSPMKAQPPAVEKVEEIEKRAAKEKKPLKEKVKKVLKEDKPKKVVKEEKENAEKPLDTNEKSDDSEEKRVEAEENNTPTNLDLSIEAVATGNFTVDVTTTTTTMATTPPPPPLAMKPCDPSLAEIRGLPMAKLRKQNYVGEYGALVKPDRDRFKCPLCPTFTTKDLNAFENHLQRELNYFKHACNICSYADVSLTNIQEHLLKEHPSRLLNGGGECCFVARPVNKPIEEWIFKLRVFQARFIKEHVDRQHKAAAAKNKTRPSDAIPTKCEEVGDVVKGETPPQEDVDGVDQQDPAMLLMEMKRVDADCEENRERRTKSFVDAVKPFTCSVCDYSNVKYVAIKRHLAKVHPNDPTAHIKDSLGFALRKAANACVYCNLDSVHKRYIINHHRFRHADMELAIRVHQDADDIKRPQCLPLAERYKCDHCDFETKQFDALALHFTTKHAGEDFNYIEFGGFTGPVAGSHKPDALKCDYLCGYCDLTFGETAALKQHFTTEHAGEEMLYFEQRKGGGKAKKPTARKSTVDVAGVKQRPVSFYGTAPELTVEECELLETEVNVNDSEVVFTVAQYAKMVDIFPIVKLVDCQLNQAD